MAILKNVQLKRFLVSTYIQVILVIMLASLLAGLQNTRANLYLNAFHFNEALSHYKRALFLKPNNVEALTGYGFCYQDLNRPDLAKASLTQAIQANPQAGDAYFVRGSLLFKEKDLAGAYNDFKKAAVVPGTYQAEAKIQVVHLKRFVVNPKTK